MAGSVVVRRRRSPMSILFYVLAVSAAAAVAAAVQPTAINKTADEQYWAKREQVAGSYNRGAFVSDPIETMNRFNNDVEKSMKANSTAPGASARRGLRHEYKGPCIATNPIDQCWRCHSDWANDRKQLAKCAMGFGHRATGGLTGEIYVVTNPADDLFNMVSPRPGTLRYGVVQDRPLWITFAHDMIINLVNELIVNSDKTIDGRGAQVHVTGAQITVQNVRNVIIHNLHIHHAVPHFGGLIRDSEHQPRGPVPPSLAAQSASAAARARPPAPAGPTEPASQPARSPRPRRRPYAAAAPPSASEPDPPSVYARIKGSGPLRDSLLPDFAATRRSPQTLAAASPSSSRAPVAAAAASCPAVPRRPVDAESTNVFPVTRRPSSARPGEAPTTRRPSPTPPTSRR